MGSRTSLTERTSVIPMADSGMQGTFTRRITDATYNVAVEVTGAPCRMSLEA